MLNNCFYHHHNYNRSDNHKHICEDTIKQINNTINCLKLELINYRRASIGTIQKRKTFGIQFINEKMTLSETFLTEEKKWAFILVRTAVIPTTFSKRKQLIKVFELLSKLLVSTCYSITDIIEYGFRY